MAGVIAERLALLETLELKRGAHKSWEGGACVMEAVAFVAGEGWTDRPQCASPVIAAFLRSWNDALPDADRQMLKPLVPALVGTRTTEADEQARAWLCVDWLARECAPAWLRLAGLTGHAEALEGLTPILSPESARAGQERLAAAGVAAEAVREAAGEAVREAAWAAAEAAREAVREAAGEAAGEAVRAAVREAEWAARAASKAAREAARAAEWAVKGRLAPTVTVLQASALRLVERMIAVGKTD